MRQQVCKPRLLRLIQRLGAPLIPVPANPTDGVTKGRLGQPRHTAESDACNCGLHVLHAGGFLAALGPSNVTPTARAPIAASGRIRERHAAQESLESLLLEGSLRWAGASSIARSAAGLIVCLREEMLGCAHLSSSSVGSSGTSAPGSLSRYLRVNTAVSTTLLLQLKSRLHGIA